jgi:ribokinase
MARVIRRDASSSIHSIEDEVTNELATIGNLQVDNVIAANGDVGVTCAGGNGAYSAVGARLWAESCLLVAHAPGNFPAAWLKELDDAGVDTRGVTLVREFRPELSEWFFYQTDGSRRDFVFASLSGIADQGVDLPRGLDERFHLESAGLAKLTTAIDAASAGRVEPMPSLDPVTRAQEITKLVGARKAVHVAPASLQLHRALTKNLSENGKLISLDPGHYVKHLQPEQLAEILQYVTIFAPSEREVYEFRGPCDLREAAEQFAAMGPTHVVIKVGPRGALVFERDAKRFHQVPAFPARTLDPTGCGDSFCGGFLAGFMETGSALEAAQYGTVAASFTVEGFGATYPLRLTRQDAERRLAMLRA